MPTSTPMNEVKISVRDFRDKLGENLDRIKRGSVLVLVSHKRPTIAMIDYEEYRRLKRAAGEEEGE
jgi:prevent-host-death family protein